MSINYLPWPSYFFIPSMLIPVVFPEHTIILYLNLEIGSGWIGKLLSLSLSLSQEVPVPEDVPVTEHVQHMMAESIKLYSCIDSPTNGIGRGVEALCTALYTYCIQI